MNITPVSTPRDFEFGTKAATLENLRGRLRGAHLCEQIFFTCEAWRRDATAILDQVLENMNVPAFAIRSSRLDEDGPDKSMAGAYESVIDVPADRNALRDAVCKVLESYGSGILPCDQVLVQPMVANVAASGVAFSQDIATGAPYVTINYDDVSGRTDTVTAGGQSKLVIVRRGGESSMRSTRFRSLIDVIYELEEITASKAVDIEFCIDAKDRIFILQVRPLAVQNSMNADDIAHFQDQLESLEHKVEQFMPVPPSVQGARTILGEMPDWNPVEMIGATPTPLAASMYKTLITDRVWSLARVEMGYRNVPEPLMVMLEGHPFIDVLRSLNSFLPASMPDTLSRRIVDAQIDFLDENQHFHDKVEFEVAVTTWDFALEQRLDLLRDSGLSPEDIERFEGMVLAQTRALLTTPQAGPEIALARVRGLRARIEGIEGLPALDHGLAILDETAPYGTIPFAILARHAFIAIAMLRSLVSIGVMSEEEYSAFLRSIHTVATDFVHHNAQLADGGFQRHEFMARYGHLRPGTYDIRVPRYDEAPERYLSEGAPNPPSLPEFEASPRLKQKIGRLLTAQGFAMNADMLFAFARTAISGRELAKFQFTRGISDALRAFCKWGEEVGIDREDIAFLRLDEIAAFAKREASLVDLRDAIKHARIRQQQDRRIRLPSLIASWADCNVIRLPLGKPNFITAKQVSGPIVLLSTEQSRSDIDGKIVVIESADPGFDWIFSHAILGLVTKFGGSNSHMAIRCAEFELPAAIGCGERNFAMVQEAGRVEIDCVGETIRV